VNKLEDWANLHRQKENNEEKNVIIVSLRGRKKKMSKRAKKEEEDGLGAGGGGGGGGKKKKKADPGMKKAELEEEEEEEDRKMTPFEQLDDKIEALEARIAKLDDDYDKCADEERKGELLGTIRERTGTLNRLLDQKARAEQGQFFLYFSKIVGSFFFFFFH
jgi:hypothetical protein